MATSGTSTWQLNRDAVIKGALRKLSVISGGSTPETYQVSDATEALNGMIKAYQADGMPLWAIKEVTFFTVAGQVQYPIGDGAAINTPAPLKVIQAYRIEQGSDNTPLNIVTRYDYNQLSRLNTSGTPVSIWYDAIIGGGQNTVGNLYLWPTPNVSTTTVSVVYQRPFEDMNSSTDQFDFPPYWTEALIYGLAARLAPEYGLGLQDQSSLWRVAEMMHANALSFGTEEGSITFAPDWTRG